MRKVSESRRNSIWVGTASFLLLSIQSFSVAGQEVAAGLTEPIVLPAHNPDLPSCSTPQGLKRELVFLKDNERDFMRGVENGLTKAAYDRGVPFRSVHANNKSDLMVQQSLSLIEEKVGAVVVAPIDPTAMAPVLQKMISRGTYVGAVVPPPAVTILNAPQYLTGKVLGDAAADYIESKLGGEADVVLLTHDNLQFLAPRFKAIRDSLDRLPGVTIIADISPLTVDRAGGYLTMNTILLANSNVDVVLGADSVVLGALDAIRAAGKERSDQFFGGIDGEPDAVAEIKKGGSYRASVSLASPIFGYAMGYQAVDWLNGKSIPQAMDILPRALSIDNIDKYEADLEDPGSVYASVVERAKYLRMYGNICYDSRDQYLNFAWSSEAN